MPLKLNSQDRKLMIGAGGVFVLLVVLSVVFSSNQGSKSEVPTTYSSGSGGAKAAYLLLQESGYDVRRWEQPLTDLPDTPRATLVLADPMQAPNREERARLKKFVSDGGLVIATGVYAPVYLSRFGSSQDPLGSMAWKKLTASSPAAITRDAPEITLAPQAFWDSSPQVLPLYGDSEHTRVVKYRLGKGEVIWWAGPTPLTNAGLKAPGNLEFFLACLREGGTTILWDEYIHGYRQTISQSAVHSPVLWIFLQLALISLAVLFTFSRRNGPIFAPVTQSRLSPLEFVETLGSLYQRAGASSVAVDVTYQRFRYWLTRRLGMASNASVADLRAAMHARMLVSDERLGYILAECESARYNPSLPPADALRLVQELDDYAAELKLFRSPRKEKA